MPGHWGGSSSSGGAPAGGPHGGGGGGGGGQAAAQQAAARAAGAERSRIQQAKQANLNAQRAAAAQAEQAATNREQAAQRDREQAAKRGAAQKAAAQEAMNKQIGTSLHGGAISDTQAMAKGEKTKAIRDLIAQQQEEKYGVGADPTKMGETVDDLAFKNHPEARAKEAEEAIKQLSTKSGTKEALREFKALDTGRRYTPDVGLLEKLGIKKPQSFADMGTKKGLAGYAKSFAKNQAMQYAAKKLGLGSLFNMVNPAMMLFSLFGGGKKPTDMSAFNKLGLQANRFPTQTMDTRTAKARDAYKKPVSTQIAKGTGLEKGYEMLGLHKGERNIAAQQAKAKTYDPNDMGTWYDTHPATGEAVMTPGFKEKYQSFGRDELNPRTVYDSYEFKDTGNPFKEEVWQRPRSYDSTQQARTYSPGQTRMSGRTSTQKPGLSLAENALALGSIPFNFGKGLFGNPIDPNALTQVSLTQAQKQRLNEIAKSKGTSTGNIDYSDYGSPTKTFGGVKGMTPLDASLATTMGGTGFKTNPDGSINYLGGKYDFGDNNLISSFIDQGGLMGASNKLGEKIYDWTHKAADGGLINLYKYGGFSG